LKPITDTVQGFVRAHLGTIIFVIGLAVIWLFLRTTGTSLASIEEFDQKIRAGQPVVVEVFTNT
jgi:hypothetical protein